MSDPFYVVFDSRHGYLRDITGSRISWTTDKTGARRFTFVEARIQAERLDTLQKGHLKCQVIEY